MASEWISILVDGQDMSAYFSQPEATGKVPGVIVIMGAFGVNRHIQEVTDNLPRDGYVAVAPVLYHRLGCTRYSAIRVRMPTCAPRQWAASGIAS